MKILQYAKALSDETRLRLVSVLSKYELNVGEIVQVMGMGQSRVSHHLKILTSAGLVTSRRDGLWMFYKAANGEGGQFLAAVSPFLSGEILDSDRSEAERIVLERHRESERFFDAVAADWQKMIREVLGDFDLAHEIAQRVPRCAVAADLGCGPGTLLPVLKKKAQTVIGVDHSQKMLDRASDRLDAADWASLRIGDLEHLPLRDREADCVLVNMALHHLSSPREGLAEAVRVLAPGGTLIVGELAKHDREELRTRHGDRWLGFDPEEVASWLSGLGLPEAKISRIPLTSGLEFVFYEVKKPATK